MRVPHSLVETCLFSTAVAKVTFSMAGAGLNPLVRNVDVGMGHNMEPHHPLQGCKLSMCREIQCCFDMSIVNYS